MSTSDRFFSVQQIQGSLLHDVAGPSTCTLKKTDPWFATLKDPWFGTLNKTDPFFGDKLAQDKTINYYSDDHPIEGYEDDYAYDEDEYEDEYDSYDASLIESEYNDSFTAEFDGLDAPGVEASLPWMQKSSIESASKAKPTKIMNEKTDEKYKAFKQFDTVDDHSDHYYSKPELRKVQIVKKVTVFACPLYTLFFNSGTVGEASTRIFYERNNKKNSPTSIAFV
jgi:ubiquitin-conjugating enzyme E2 O